MNGLPSYFFHCSRFPPLTAARKVKESVSGVNFSPASCTDGVERPTLANRVASMSPSERRLLTDSVRYDDPRERQEFGPRSLKASSCQEPSGARFIAVSSTTVAFPLLDDVVPMKLPMLGSQASNVTLHLKDDARPKEGFDSMQWK